MTDLQSGAESPRRDRAVERVFPALPYLSLLGFGGLLANVLLSFEAPHTPMLLVAALLIIATPVVLLTHLVTTAQLTRREKLLWIRGLVSRNGPVLFAAYFNAAQRRAATASLAAGARSPGGQA
jgi:hypothetical protein